MKKQPLKKFPVLHTDEEAAKASPVGGLCAWRTRFGAWTTDEGRRATDA